ncbi:MAG: hypothetical protein ABIP49_06810 [Lysobacterales bacterium]
MLAVSPDRNRDSRRSGRGLTAHMEFPDETSRFDASRALWVWLACGLVLTLTCPPLASAQTLLGAAPLWLIGLPVVSLVLIAMGRSIGIQSGRVAFRPGD